VILGSLSTFGTHLVLLGEVSKEPARREEVLRYAIPTTFACGGVLLAVYLTICRLTLSETGTTFHVLLALGFTEAILQPLIALIAAEHHGLGRIARSQLLTILPLILRLGAALSVFAAKPVDPLGDYAYGYVAASMAALAFLLATLPASWPHPGSWRLPTVFELREAAGFAALNITRSAPAELDKTLSTKLLPLTEAGVYAASARIIAASTLPISAMTIAALPRLFREGRIGSHPPPHHLVGTMFAAATIYSLVLASAIWGVAPALEWVFGPTYRGIGEVIRWLCLAIPGMALRLTAGNVLMSLGRPWMRVAFETVGATVLLATAIVFTRASPAIGMPLALAASEWAMVAIGVGQIFKLLSRSKHRE
jgi:O-antigen/teichoic acid export membrane protein